jgi:haloalkane dehalogenase
VEAGLAQFAQRPMLIGWGEKDWCFTTHFRQDWERRFPGALVKRFDDAGHYVIEDAWDALAPTIRAFAEGELDAEARPRPEPPKKARRAAVGLDA